LKIIAVELQPRLCAAAQRTMRENGMERRVSVLSLDLADEVATRRLLAPASFDLLISNPPYRPLGEGPVSPDLEEAIARHEVRLTLAHLVSEAKRLLERGGSFAVVYPAARLSHLLRQLETSTLQPVRLRLVHPKASEPATLALIEAQSGTRSPMRVDPPFILRSDSGAYTEEAKRALGESPTEIGGPCAAS
jgi:tRNA1Val (adenine37-N6)-methyltransferase